MQLELANVKNLTQLWDAYGSVSLSDAPENSVKLHPQWPYRSWPCDTLTSIFTDNQMLLTGDNWLEKLPRGTVVPLWISKPKDNHLRNHSVNTLQQQLEQRQWHSMLEQTAMYREIKQSDRLPPPLPMNFCVEPVQSEEGVNAWCEVVKQAFNYTIPSAVIQNLMGLQHVHIVLLKYCDVPVATGLLFKTGEVIGIHQVGVRPSYQGRGIARQLMQQLINLGATTLNGRYLVLQASQSAENLYKSLGFKRQFSIKSYQKKIES